MSTELIEFDAICQLLKKADIKALEEITRYLELTPAEEAKRMYENIIDKLKVIYGEHGENSFFEVNEIIEAIIKPPFRENDTVVRELSDEVTIIGSAESIKDVTLEKMMNLELPPSATLRETPKDQ